MFNPDAENALLSILIKNPEKYFDVPDIKSPMFSSTPAQTLHTHISELVSKGITPEYTMLVEYLKSKNSTGEVGGEEYIKYLIGLDVDPVNVKEFEKLVINSYRARTLLTVVSNVKNKLTSTDSVPDVISYMKSSIDNLDNISGGSTVIEFKDALKDAWEDVVRKVEGTGQNKITSGFRDIDAITGGFGSGEVWVVAGRTSMGKSAWACNSILKTAKEGNPVLVFSLEMDRISLAHRFLALETGIPITNIRLGTLSSGQVSQIAKAIEVIKSLPIYIESNFSIDINYIVSTAKKYRNTKGTKVLYVDYIQLLAERGNQATHDLGNITRELKLLSNDIGITSVILSQLNRLLEGRDDKRPILSDLRQSGNIEEDADLAIFLYRDVVYNSNTKNKDVIENIIRKHRNGPTGMIPLKFNEETNLIT